MMYYQKEVKLSLLVATFLFCSRPTHAFRRHPSFFLDNNNASSNYDYTHKRRLQNEPTDNQNAESIIQQTVNSAIKSISDKRSTSSLLQPDDHLVTDLPYLDPDTLTTKHYAGHIPASQNDDKKLFYWLFEPDTSGTNHNDDDIPLLIWLNGGPGCSSMDGLFLENGPLRLVKSDESSSSSSGDGWSIQINPYSWHKAPAYVLYIDQPVGTGLSFTKSRKYCKNDLEVNIDFHLFLENFLIMYQDFFLNKTDDDIAQRTMKRPLYFSGESHAGHYIPSMMAYILQRNDDDSKTTYPRVKMALKGAAIGNGWIDPYYQYSASDLAYSLGMIDLAQKADLDEQEEHCRRDLESGKLRSTVCFDLLDNIINDSGGKLGTMKVSIYDNRVWEKNGQPRSFPLGHTDVETFLGGHVTHNGMKVDYKNVLKAIHAEESISSNQQFRECTDPPYDALSHQDGLGVTREVVEILEHHTKPKLLIFNGMNDMICNHVGNEKLLDKLEWRHTKDWMLAKRYAWDFKSVFYEKNHGPAGYVKEYDNLTFLKVASSGHMVPMDLPDVALEMIRKLLFQSSFGSNYQKMERSVPQDKDNCEYTTRENGGIDDDVDEADDTRILFTKEFISGGWFGTAVGVTIMLIFNVWKNLRIPKRRQLVPVDHNNEESFGYSDDPETELVISPKKRGGREGELI